MLRGKTDPAYTKSWAHLPLASREGILKALESHCIHYLVYVKYQTTIQGIENGKRHGGYKLRYRRKYEPEEERAVVAA
jgi:hypothetical protein